ncbi:hypothetical protein VTK73DRAFT_3743 [Phialemonium thermophilum]|uniref:Calpain catalytic domain-containing protein n=1 Tax=Phialemonium thermophilum TaxID=223376 RepID=A0ABR3Y0R5_9PEZI
MDKMRGQPSSSRHGRRGKRKTPQQKLDAFWKRFITNTPGKAMTVIPQNQYTSRTISRGVGIKADGGDSVGITTAPVASYEEAAAICQAKVDKIVSECRRVNQKYRDPHFDLEFDLKMDLRDCLDSLNNRRRPTVVIDDVSSSDGESKSGTSSGSSDMSSDAYDSSGSSSSRSPHRFRSRTYRGQRGENHKTCFGAKTKGHYPDRLDDSRIPRPRDKDPKAIFRPKSVKRVGEIFEEPKFYIEGPTANDVRQGRDGDCWLMAALCTLSNKPGLIEKICVARNEEVGVYGFVFHRDGEWFSEIIDDKLYLTKPDYDEVNLERVLWEDRDRVNTEETYRKTYQSNSGALYFAQCENPNETWLPLLEKAYAKAHGDYSAIDGGFTGEGIEDLTGGVTSELFTTDILDKEHFWREELMKVNEQFLFGCSTGIWGRGWGERKGIYELHAYSVMRAVDIDGERLLLLKNPLGKGEWKGAWSDGSKEWTPEWLKKLNHRFGDDGAFWISYEDLLRKYQAFDRTRLFGPDWRVASIWTVMAVPWTLEYHDTKFAFNLTKPGPVVLVLSQLDDRYFRGLEGQYRFELSFRLHRAGEDDYLVRSQTNYRMMRSVNIELELEAGEYWVLVKIDAVRDDSVMPLEDVVRAQAKARREKLMRIGMAYDMAHSKCRVIETPEEKKAREAHESRKREKERQEMRDKLLKAREKEYYFRKKRFERQKKKLEKRKEKQRAREEKRQTETSKATLLDGASGSKRPKTASIQEPRPRDGNAQDTKGISPTTLSSEHRYDMGGEGNLAAVDTNGLRDEPDAPFLSEDHCTEQSDTENGRPVEEGKRSLETVINYAEQVSSVTPPQEHSPYVPRKPNTEVSGKSSNDEGQQRLIEGDNPESFSDHSQTPDPPPAGKPDQEAALEAGDDPNSAETSAKARGKLEEATYDNGKGELVANVVCSATGGPRPSTSAAEQQLSREQTFHSVRSSPDENPDLGSSTADSSLWETEAHNKQASVSQAAAPTLSEHRGQVPRTTASQPPPGYPSHRPIPSHGLMPQPAGYRVERPVRPMGRGLLGTNPESDDDGPSSLSSMSDVTDRELDFMIEDYKQRPTPPLPVRPLPQRTAFRDGKDSAWQRDPWNAVAAIGFRVFYKLSADAGRSNNENEKNSGKAEDRESMEKEAVVRLRIIRPSLYRDIEGREDGKDAEKLKGGKADASKVLDLDDSAKDATLHEPEMKIT